MKITALYENILKARIGLKECLIVSICVEEGD